MPEYKDVATRLREATKRDDLPTGIVSLLSEAYAEIDRLERKIKSQESLDRLAELDEELGLS